MRHDIERVRAEIEKFHGEIPESGDRDLDDFTLVHLSIEPSQYGQCTLEVSRWDGECEIELVAAHAFMKPRKVLLQFARVLGPDDLWPPLDARMDFAAVKLDRHLPEPLRDTGRIIPGPRSQKPEHEGWGGRPMVMSVEFLQMEHLDVVLVYDRFPLSTP